MRVRVATPGPRIHSRFGAGAAAIAVLALAGCGGGGGSPPPQQSNGNPPPPPPPTQYTIGGTVSGLSGTGLVLQDNGGDDLAIQGDGAFTFATKVNSGAAYAVTVKTQPSSPTQTCTVANASGTASVNVTNVAVSCTTPGGGSSVGKFAYVANNGDGTISAYTIDSSSGALAAVSGSPYPDGTAPAAVSLAPNGKFAFSASDNGTKVHAFTIDQTRGALTEVAGSPFSTGFKTGSTFPDIAVDAQSAHLYLASAGDDEVAGFAIDQTSGALTPLKGSPYAAGTGASAIPAFSPDGKFLYVMDQTANAVSGYAIGTDGSLTPMASSFPTGAGPTWISFTPDGKFAYVSDTGVDEISAYSVNATTGALTALSTPMFATDEHPEDLTIDSSGTHLYAPVANGSTPGAVDVFTINAAGTLTLVGSTPAGVTPVFLDIEPTGHFGYVSSKGGAEVYGYSISASTGALTPLTGSPYSTGAGSLPQFITIDPSGKFGYTANEGTASLSGFAINSTTGVLTPIPGSPFPAGLKPIFVSISPEAPGIRD